MSDQNSIEAAGFRFTDDELIDNPELREQIEAFIEIGREEKRRRCMTDLLFLGREILGYKDLTDETEAYKHVELMLDRKGAYARPFNLILIPRDTLKTTLISITKNIQRIIRDGNVRILITNAVMDNARKMLHEIKAHLSENPKFIDLFGNMKGKIWREDEITVSTRTVSCKEMTVEISSETNTKTSKHFDFIDADDLVTRDGVNTAEAKYKTFLYFQDLLDILDHPDGVIDVVGTRWDFGDLYSTILDPNEKYLPYFNTLVMGAYDENGRLNFPLKLGLERLQMLKATKNALEFSAQYLNDPVPAADAIFKEIYFKRDANMYDKDDYIDQELPTYLLFDPAATKNKKSDYTAGIEIKVDPEGNWLVWWMMNDKLVPGKIEKTIFKKHLQCKPRKTAIETIGFQAYVKQGVEKLMKANKVFFGITELEPKGRNKDDRILALEPLLRYGAIKFPKQGIVYVNDEGRPMDMVFALRDQLIKFPASKKKDLSDVLAYACDIIPMEARAEMKEEIAKHVSSVLEENEVENRKLEFAKSGRKDDEPQFMIADNYEEESAYGY